MSVLITQQSVRVLDPVPPIIQITRARLIPDSTPVPPKVVLPQKPVKEEKIFNEPIKVPGPTGYSRRFISAPGTGGEIAIPGVQVKINAVAVSDRNATPIVRVNPVYPAAQAQRNVEGWVEVEFTITATGSVSDPRVTSAEPRGAFDRAALHAIERWKYEPMLVNGKPTAQSGVRTRLLFELN
jgi:protein TonB